MMLPAAQRRVLLGHPAGWIASGFGSGLSPVAPGTAGSLAALLPWLALRELSVAWCLAFMVLAFAVGVWACGWVVRSTHVDDPGFVVWDEFVGQWIALLPLLWRLQEGILCIFAAFIFFRIFDIAKPWPVSWADRRLTGGLGVMLDDVLAGIYAALAMAALMHFMG